MNGLLIPQPIRIAELYEDGEDSRHFTFEPVGDTSIQQAKPGQFFNLTVPGHGEAAFTYLSLPDSDGRCSALIRKVGDLTSALFERSKGDLLGYRGPFGQGIWPLDQLKGKRVLVLAGGCGLAPLASIIEALLADNETQLGLIYGSRDPANQNLERERAAWHKQLPIIEAFDLPAAGTKYIGTPLNHIDAILAQLGGEPEAVLTCGPEVMMNAAADLFIKRGLSGDNIWLALERRMHCGVGLCGHCYLGSSYVCVDGPVYSWNELTRLRGTTTTT
ncbi:FAD/NAD(P)-binding protein [Pseudomonadota bacterium]